MMFSLNKVKEKKNFFDKRKQKIQKEIIKEQKKISDFFFIFFF